MIYLHFEVIAFTNLKVKWFCFVFMTKVKILWHNYLSFLILQGKKSWFFEYSVLTMNWWHFLLFVFKCGNLSYPRWLSLSNSLKFYVWFMKQRPHGIAALFTKNLTCKISHQVFLIKPLMLLLLVLKYFSSTFDFFVIIGA